MNRMRLKIIIEAAMFLLIAAAGAAAAQKDKTASLPPIQWYKTLDEAVAAAEKYCRPILLHLSPVGKMSRNEDYSTFDNDEVKQLIRYFVPVRIDPENADDLVKKFEVDDFPAIMLLDAQMKQYGINIEGHADPQDLIKALKAVLEKVKTVTPERAAVMEALDKKATEAFAKRDFSTAAKYLNRIIAFKPDSGFTKDAKKKLEDIAFLGKEALARAKGLADSGKSPEAVKEYRKIQKEFKGLPEEEIAASEARELMKNPADSKPAPQPGPPAASDNGSGVPANPAAGNSSETKPKENPPDPEAEAQKIFDRGFLYETNGARAQAIEAYRELLRKYPKCKIAYDVKKRLEKLEESAPKESE
jgi:tetratricopeptide (TPR) repeat protein